MKRFMLGLTLMSFLSILPVSLGGEMKKSEMNAIVNGKAAGACPFNKKNINDTSRVPEVKRNKDGKKSQIFG